MPPVSGERVVDFDFYRPGDVGLDPFSAFTRLLGKPPVVWTPHNGGHWIVTNGRVSKEVLTDPDRFSSESVFIPRVDRPRTVPLEYDPPEHTAMRRAIRGTFLPGPVKDVVERSFGDGVSELFLIGAPIALVALVAVLFLREVPLGRKSGIQQALELEAQDANDEPVRPLPAV